MLPDVSVCLGGFRCDLLSVQCQLHDAVGQLSTNKVAHQQATEEQLRAVSLLSIAKECLLGFPQGLCPLGSIEKWVNYQHSASTSKQHS